MSQVTNYQGISKIYFKKILFEIIKIGSLFEEDKKILDYGCGKKYLEKILNRKILNYDIDPNYNEIRDINQYEFDIVIFNHVLMYLKPNEIENLFKNIYQKNSNCKFVIGIGKQNLISKIAKILTFNFTAHDGTVSNYNDQIKVIKKNMKIINKKTNIYFMTDIFYTKFTKYV